MIDLVAYHGWGFDRNFWRPMQNLATQSVQWRNFDRGYFGTPKNPVPDSKCDISMILTHSFGLHFCQDKALKEADLVAVFSGFLVFHPKAVQFRRRSKMVLNEMIKQFESQPENVLKTFYRNVFHPDKSYELPKNDFNKDLLMRDLKKLDKAERSLPDLKKTAKVCIFQGADDAIVPKQKGRGLYEKFGKQAQYYEIKNSGHALPYTYAEKCWNVFRGEIKKIKSR